jgi:hypothetical protein
MSDFESEEISINSSTSQSTPSTPSTPMEDQASVLRQRLNKHLEGENTEMNLTIKRKVSLYPRDL